MKSEINPTKLPKSIVNVEQVEPSGGKVFADLGCPDAEERPFKDKLATKVAQID